MSILTAVVLGHNKANIPHPPPSSLCKTAVQISLVCAWNILRSFKSTLWGNRLHGVLLTGTSSPGQHACTPATKRHWCMDRGVGHKNNQTLPDAAGTPNHFSEVSGFIIGALTNQLPSISAQGPERVEKNTLKSETKIV